MQTQREQLENSLLKQHLSRLENDIGICSKHIHNLHNVNPCKAATKYHFMKVSLGTSIHIRQITLILMSFYVVVTHSLNMALI